MKEKIYVGLTEDLKEGMGPTVKLILDAKVFGLIDDAETCEGWRAGGIQNLYEKVTVAWEPFGHLPSRLPDDLRARHEKFFGDAIKVAREEGWDPDREVGSENV